jgi:hypothetical protein
MPRKPSRPGLIPSPAEDPAFAVIVAILAELPRRDRNELLAFLDFWRELPREDRAIFARTLRPDLGEDAVARLSGVSPRTLLRWARYQEARPKLADFGRTRRRPAKRRASTRGTSIDLDAPTC